MMSEILSEFGLMRRINHDNEFLVINSRLDTQEVYDKPEFT